MKSCSIGVAEAGGGLGVDIVANGSLAADFPSFSGCRINYNDEHAREDKQNRGQRKETNTPIHSDSPEGVGQVCYLSELDKKILPYKEKLQLKNKGNTLRNFLPNLSLR